MSECRPFIQEANFSSFSSTISSFERDRYRGERRGGISVWATATIPASRPDEDNPEWTGEDFRRARPALEVVAELLGPQAAEAFRRGRGRPAKPDRKVNQTLRLDPDVLEAYRHEGAGWQTRINAVLREHMPKPRE